jgi:hypothetical protein
MNAKQRASNRRRQREWRARQKAEQLKELTPEKVWARNRANLTADAIQDLESRQYRLAEIASAMEALIEDLTAGNSVGPPDGTLFPDVLYEEVCAFEKETNPGNLVVHFDTDEFIKLHLPENKRILGLFWSADPEWFDYGYHTRLTHDRYNRFLKCCVDHFRLHQGNENIDQVLANQAIKEYGASHYRREPILSHVNFTEDGAREAVRLRQIGAEKREEEARLREVLWSQREMLRSPLNPTT